MYDLLIKNGTVVDGTGAPRFQADVAVKDGKIARIAPEIAEGAETVIDARGLVVAPGFIDTHTHSDGTVFSPETTGYNHLEDGATTELAGQCGSMAAPYYGEFDPSHGISREEYERICESYTSYFAYVDSIPHGANLAFFAGQGPIRGKVMGFGDGTPDEEQLEQMRGLMREAMECGCLGFSTGLVYTPSVFAGTHELVEIAKAVSYNSKVIVFDEPTSSLTEEEVEHLFRIINMLRDRGCGIIYISHKMKEILRISDDVTIMRDGQWIATKPAKDLTMNEIIKLMVGRELTNLYPEKDNVVGEPLLEVKGLTAAYSKLRDVSFVAKKGEVLGIAGLDGSGRTELLENIFGIATRKEGEIYLHGKRVMNRNARESIKNKFALLTEERRATGIFGIRDIQANTTISSFQRYKVGPFLSDKKMSEATEWGIKAMRTKTPSQRTQIRSLSGGNQQKVILARWLLTEPEVLLLDEPTRGIDVGAKYEIYQLILNLAKEGKTVLMVSSEMPELLGVCDRILVMSGGQLAGEVDARTTTQEEIMALAAKFA